MAEAKIATVYAEALLQFALEKTGANKTAEQAAVEALETELREVAGAIRSTDMIWAFFRSPVVQPEDKLRVLERAVKSVLSPQLYNFLGVLCKRRRVDELPGIVRAFSALADEKIGRRHVLVTSAHALSDEEKKKLEDTVRELFKKSIVLENKVRPELLGGLVIRSEGSVLDTSISSRLKRIKQRMLDRKILGEAYYEN